MLEGILFDLFGTLLIYGDMAAAWEDWLAALHRFLAGRGFIVSHGDLAGACQGIMSWPEPPIADDGLTVYERRLRELGANLGIEMDAAALRGAAEASISAWQVHVTLDPDAIPVLRALGQRGPLVGLVSNFDHPPHVQQLLGELGLARFFGTILVSGDVGVKKPDPAILRLAMDQMGLHSERTAYVGDSDEDMQAALAAHVLPILIRRPTSGDQPPVIDYGRPGSTDLTVGRSASDTHVIASLRDLSRWVR